jgi:hypothetical protein
MNDCCSSSGTVAAQGNEDDLMLCYCFGFTKQDYKDDASVRDYVIEQTRAGNCSCSTKNPSGQCCLKDFPRVK